MLPDASDIRAATAESPFRKPVLSGFAVMLLLFAAVAGWSLSAELGDAAAHGAAPAGKDGRRTAMHSRQAAERELRLLISELAEELAVQRALLQSVKVQRAFNETERAHVERLYDSGFARLPRLLQLQIEAGELANREESVGVNIERLSEALAAATRDLETAQASRQSGGALAEAGTPK